MIVHQEKFSQQQQLQKQQQQIEQQQQQQNKFSLLSSLLSSSNESNNVGAVGANQGVGAKPVEKVAKAMKRTAMVSAPAPPPPRVPLTTPPQPTDETKPPVRLGKAVKHTAPIRSSNSNIILNDQTNHKGIVLLIINIKFCRHLKKFLLISVGSKQQH